LLSVSSFATLLTVLTDVKLAYLAGIMDGEGHFSIVKYTRKDKQKRVNGTGLKVESRISQGRRLLLDTIASWFQPGDTNIVKAGKDGAYFMLRFNYHCLRELIPALMPHLVLKRRQAEICLYFLVNQHTTGRKPFPSSEWQHRLELHDECRQLNISPQRKLRDNPAENKTPISPEE
jgi:hypothetical protein